MATTFLLRFFTVTLLFGCLSGCGYAFSGAGTILPPDVKNIYIPPVENNSTELGLSNTVTEALREQFESYGVVSIVERQSEADAVLTAKVMQVQRNTRTTSSNSDTARQLETTLLLSAELRRVTGPTLWRDDKISISRAFASDANVVVTSSSDFATGSISGSDLANLSVRDVARGQEAGALTAVAQEAARQIYDAAVAPDF
jgi:outer membrane lipopolysaccharide assembly protein LptE/RlpB